VKIREERDVSIEEVSRRGNAIAKIQNFGAFVLGTEVGNKVTKDASRFTIAERV
jgi:predicted RNA-binding protein with TRAM domain